MCANTNQLCPRSVFSLTTACDHNWPQWETEAPSEGMAQGHSWEQSWDPSAGLPSLSPVFLLVHQGASSRYRRATRAHKRVSAHRQREPHPHTRPRDHMCLGPHTCTPNKKTKNTGEPHRAPDRQPAGPRPAPELTSYFSGTRTEAAIVHCSCLEPSPPPQPW